ncbi:MAG: alpha/beta hydrolase [Dactylosporangium sp.]|nr:alpha/beta hydrolase [Dactylosporangium sp.]NNJ61880.1 alpha/beta hydrolase [Dactylosporangium sp.]
MTTSATDATVYTISGRLCLRDESLRGSKTVELMVSGLTYDHNYFNISYQPNTYSHVYAATSNGYSTFNIDRLGVGFSSKPPADKLTVQAHAYTIEQIIRKLRSGAIGGRAFTNVVGVGHSLGAGVLQYLAATVTDPVGVPDYLVLSGWLHDGGTTALVLLADSLYEASLDPAFASAGLPSGYYTTLPGSRGPNFYNATNAEAVMINLDESLKQTGTLAERQTLGAVRSSTITLNIQVPVLLSVGQNDDLQCDEAAGLSCATAAAVVARESPFYSAKACLTAYSVIGSGHSVNLHYKARESYNYSHTWLDSYTVNNVNNKDANGCLPAP